MPVDQPYRIGLGEIEVDVRTVQMEDVEEEPFGGAEDFPVQGLCHPSVGFPVHEAR